MTPSKIERAEGGVQNPPAFPTFNEYEAEHVGGMTLRDWFAGQWLAGCLAGNAVFRDAEGVAEEAWGIADAMLAARGDA